MRNKSRVITTGPTDIGIYEQFFTSKFNNLDKIASSLKTRIAKTYTRNSKSK